MEKNHAERAARRIASYLSNRDIGLGSPYRSGAPSSFLKRGLQFWRVNPALLAALSLLIAIATVLFSFPAWIFCLWTLYLIFLRRWAFICLMALGGIYVSLLYRGVPSTTPIECSARFSISSLQKHQTPFHHNLLYRGVLYYGGAALPCSIAISPSEERPLASSDYIVEGNLIEREPFDYIFKPTRWHPIPRTWSLAEIRFRTKEAVRTFLQSKRLNPKTTTLLSSLATGEVEDRQLRYEFGRLGLQHLLAISGFHFGVLLTFMSLLLGLFLPSKPKWIAMIVLTTAYFLFIGSSPAVQRAWLAASLFLLGKLLRRRADPLNLLGAAMLIELLLTPLSAGNLGFQLSFGSCFGILLFYQLFDKTLHSLFPARAVSEALTLSIPSQCTYLLSTTFRRSLSLTFAVNAAILPLLLYHFGRFPYLSLLYNLFIPFFVSIALFGLFTICILSFALGPVSDPLFSLLDSFCTQILDFISYPPLCLDYSLYAPEFSPVIPAISLFTLFSLRLCGMKDNQPPAAADIWGIKGS